MGFSCQYGIGGGEDKLIHVILYWMGTQSAENWILFFTLIAVVVYAWFTKRQIAATNGLAKWERERWELDSRREEWRRLLGTLTTCVHRIMTAKCGPQSQKFPASLGWESDDAIREALLEAAQVIQNRVFVRDELLSFNLEDAWKEIEKQGDFPPVAINANVTVFNFTDFQQNWKHLHNRLVEAARRDLKIT